MNEEETQKQISTIFGMLTTMANQLTEIADREIQAQNKLVLCRALIHVHFSALLALAKTHPNKVLALQALQKVWNSARGGLGSDAMSDQVREETQQQLDGLAAALGGKIL